jgi:phosphoribosyl 1,2-cyclic phosphate phosphodiesterase
LSLRITFLGTGTSQGVPVIACNCKVCRSSDKKDNRLRTSILIETEKKKLIIDAGPDFRYQVLRAGIPTLDLILFTHEHRDHIAGLDDVRSFNFKQKEFHYVFGNNKYPGIPQLEIHEIVNEPFVAAGLKVIPIQVLHHKLPVFGFRIDDFTYITDANSIPEKEMEKIKGSKTIVLNALQKDDHISHFTLDEALKVIEQLNPERAYLTHLSHKMGLYEEVSDDLPPNVFLAYDTLSIMA